MLKRYSLQWFLVLISIYSLLDASYCQEIDENSTGSSNSSSKSGPIESRNIQQQRSNAIKEEEKRLWGSPSNEHATHNEVPTDQYVDTTTTTTATATATATGASKENSPSALPFVGKSSSTSSIPQQYGPPKGFEITARVYTDPSDKLAHFDNDGSIVFPYWECGVSGSSTVPIPLQHATVRHLLGGSKPNLYSGEEFGPHPQLVIALTSLEVLLNSGQAQTFAPGDVLLLEDVLSGGHKLKGSGQNDMTVMILTLPQHYHQVGKDKSSLQSLLEKASQQMNNPCPDQMEPMSVDDGNFADKVAQSLQKLQPRSIRRYVLGVIGLSITTLLGDFMGKVAPLWLAVVFGGGCFVTGGTYCFVKVGDYCLDELETWQERRQLQLQGDSDDDDADDNNDITTETINAEKRLEYEEEASHFQ